MVEEKYWNIVCLIQHTAAFHISKDFKQYFFSGAVLKSTERSDLLLLYSKV